MPQNTKSALDALTMRRTEILHEESALFMGEYAPGYVCVCVTLAVGNLLKLTLNVIALKQNSSLLRLLMCW